MDPSAAFCLRNSLDTVHAAFVFQTGVSPLSCDHEHTLFETADPVFVERDHLCPPAPAVRIVHIHTVDLRGEKRRLVSARAPADLHDYVLIIVRVLGQKKDLQFLLQLFHALLGLVQLLLRQLAHLLVRLFLQDGKAVVNILLAFLVLIVCFHDGRKVALLLHQPAEPLLIVRRSRLLQLSHYFFIPNQKIV